MNCWGLLWMADANTGGGGGAGAAAGTGQGAGQNAGQAAGQNSGQQQGGGAAAAAGAAATGQGQQSGQAGGQNAGQQQAPAKKERPTNVPEKFWDSEKGELRLDALLQSNTELETKLGKGEHKKPAPTEAPKSGKEAVGRVLEARQAQPALLEKARLEYLQSGGKVSDKLVGEMEAAGLGSRQIIQDTLRLYAEEQSRIYGLADERVFEGKLEEHFNWYHTLPDAQRKVYDSLLENPETVMVGLFAIKAHKQVVDSGAGSLLEEGAGGGGAGELFANEDEYQKAVRTRKYQKDPAHKKAMDDKMIRSLPHWKK